MKETNRVLYLSHGGGPRPLLGDPSHRELVGFIEQLRATTKRPSAIVVISAHWEADKVLVTGAERPPLVYDYYNFPEEAYLIRYPAPGSPALARRLVAALDNAEIPAGLDPGRGLDHGVFVPLKILFPEADIPCIEVSLNHNLDPGHHIEIGEALAALPQENLLFIGSGFSFHNMAGFSGLAKPALDVANRQFEHWLQDTLTGPEILEAERRARLVAWARAPGARLCHPREEHLLPLHVCYGLAGRPPTEAYTMDVMSRQASAFLW